MIEQDAHLLAAGAGVHPDNLLIAAKFPDGDLQSHQVDVESALTIFARIAQLQEVKDRLYIGVEAIITLTCKRNVPVAQCGDGLFCVKIKISLLCHSLLGRILTIIALIVEGSGVALIVRRNDTGSQNSL